jgi:uncharacterized protein YciI
MREQEGWPEHARFMNDLDASGFIVLGGPLGDGEQSFLLICDAEDEDAVRSRFTVDPWSGSKLEVSSVEPWEVLLGHTPRQ